MSVLLKQLFFSGARPAHYVINTLTAELLDMSVGWTTKETIKAMASISAERVHEKEGWYFHIIPGTSFQPSDVRNVYTVYYILRFSTFLRMEHNPLTNTSPQPIHLFGFQLNGGSKGTEHQLLLESWMMPRSL